MDNLSNNTIDTSMPINLTDESFPKFISTPGVKLIYVKAAWCGPCRMLAPVIDELAREWDGRIQIGKVDVDDCDETSVELRIRSVPSLFVYKNGDIIERKTGVLAKPEIVALFSGLINEETSK